MVKKTVPKEKEIRDFTDGHHDRLYDWVVILPTRRLHDSGFRMMRVLGYVCGPTGRDTGKLYVISETCDSIQLETSEARENLLFEDDFRFDIDSGGVQHMYFRWHYVKASGHSTVTITRTDIGRDRF